LYDYQTVLKVTPDRQTDNKQWHYLRHGAEKLANMHQKRKVHPEPQGS